MGSVRLSIPQGLALAIRDTAHVTHLVETGLWKGGTTSWAAAHFEKVTTIEAYEPRRLKTLENLRQELPADQYERITFVAGDSRTCLAEHLTNPPVLAWLDAHWCGNSTYGQEVGNECALREELQQINEHAPDTIILIDDARLFFKPPPIPHDPAQWPTWEEVSELLAVHHRLVIEHEDVIFAVPNDIESWFYEWSTLAFAWERGELDNYAGTAPGLVVKAPAI